MLEVGTVIRIVRQAREMRLGQLATASKLSTPYLSLVEGGMREPSLRALRNIAQALDMPVEVLMLLACPRDGSLRSEDERTCSLVESVRMLATAEDSLRAKLSREEGADGPQ